MINTKKSNTAVGTRQLYLLEDGVSRRTRSGNESQLEQRAGWSVRRLSTTEEIRDAVQRTRKDTLWIVEGSKASSDLVLESLEQNHWDMTVVFKGPVDKKTQKLIPYVFQDAIVVSNKKVWLAEDELIEAVTAENSEDLFIGGVASKDYRSVALRRGDFSKLIVPMELFRPSGDGTKPDFSRFSVTDYGNTLKFGDYEASADGVLYECDAAYRRKMNATRRTEKKSLGASLRRLRKQKGLRRSDFGELDEKTIARIERDEVTKPHKDTLEILAGRLGVKADEIETY